MTATQQPEGGAPIARILSTKSPGSGVNSWLGPSSIFVAGMLLWISGPIVYLIQLHLKILATPWYLPILSTVGIALMAGSLLKRPGIIRGLILAPFVLLCGLEWFTLAYATRSPDYTGPAQPGRKVPSFKATLASGVPFTESDLEAGSSTVLVFFRGRW